jgi:hypothetical protein
MDKHQRKQLARWEQKKAKTEHAYIERMKEYESYREWDKVATAVEKYTPSPASVFTAALTFLKEPLFRTIPPNWYWHFIVDLHGPFLTVNSRGRFIAPPPPDPDVEVREGRERKDKRCALELIPTLVRHMDRVDAIREELLVRSRRNRAVQDCLAIKEELMAAAWHPRRVGRVLDLYGWEALDNLLGVE